MNQPRTLPPKPIEINPAPNVLPGAGIFSFGGLRVNNDMVLKGKFWNQFPGFPGIFGITLTYVDNSGNLSSQYVAVNVTSAGANSVDIPDIQLQNGILVSVNVSTLNSAGFAPKRGQLYLILSVYQKSLNVSLVTLIQDYLQTNLCLQWTVNNYPYSDPLSGNGYLIQQSNIFTSTDGSATYLIQAYAGTLLKIKNLQMVFTSSASVATRYPGIQIVAGTLTDIEGTVVGQGYSQIGQTAGKSLSYSLTSAPYGVTDKFGTIAFPTKNELIVYSDNNGDTYQYLLTNVIGGASGDIWAPGGATVEQFLLIIP